LGYTPSPVAFGAYLKCGLSHLDAMATVAESTASDYRYYAERFLISHLGHIPLVDLSPEDLNLLHARLIHASREPLPQAHEADTPEGRLACLDADLRPAAHPRLPLDGVQRGRNDLARQPRPREDHTTMERYVHPSDRVRREAMAASGRVSGGLDSGRCGSSGPVGRGRTQRTPRFAGIFGGAPGRIRTSDTWFRKPY
jgi:hypothetical protein